MISLNQPAGRLLMAFMDIPDGGLVETEAMIDNAMESLIVHRDGETVRGWLNICPHAGRRLDWTPGQFLLSHAGHLVCAAHGASFSLVDGVCVAGPCRGEALRMLTLEVKDHQIWLTG